MKHTELNSPNWKKRRGKLPCCNLIADPGPFSHVSKAEAHDWIDSITDLLWKSHRMEMISGETATIYAVVCIVSFTALREIHQTGVDFQLLPFSALGLHGTESPSCNHRGANRSCKVLSPSAWFTIHFL